MNDLNRERDTIQSRIEGRTLLDAFEDTCRRQPDATALVILEDGEPHRRTWGDYRDTARAVAMGLRRLGVDHGAHVAIMLANRPEHVICDVGALLAGGVPTSVYNTLPAEQLAYVADDSRAVVAIVEDAAFLERWLAIRDRLPELRTLVVLDPAGADLSDEHVMTFADLVAAGSAALAEADDELGAVRHRARPDDTATLIYTSGTTGPPKGVVLTHGNVLYQVEANASYVEIHDGQRVVSYLPLAHIAERMFSHYLAIGFGFEVWFVPDVTKVLDTLLQARPHHFLGVPRVWEKMRTTLLGKIEETPGPRRALAQRAVAVGTRKADLELRGGAVPRGLRLQHGLFDKVVLSKIRHGLGLDEIVNVVSGAAPLHEDLVVFFHGIGLEVLDVYGLTESTAVVASNRPGRVRLGTVGFPLPGTEVRVAEDGEVLARGPHIFTGYLNREDATREAIDEDGWFHTGDLGALDDEGVLRITGRKKDLIVTSGGKNLSPTNIEDEIKQRSPIISQVCAVGDGRAYVAALVALDDEALPPWCERRGIPFTSFAALTSHPQVVAEVERAVAEGNARLHRAEQVKQWTIPPVPWRVDTDELTPSQKLKREVVTAKHADLIDRLYSAST